MDKVTPVEMLMLRYVGKGIKSDMEFPGYWKYQYNVNAQKLIEDLLNKGFLIQGDIEISLQHEDSKKLKEILASKSLKVSGKKADLIERILTNIDNQELLKLNFPVYLILSEAGKRILEDSSQPEMKEHFEAKMVYGDIETVLPVLKLIGKKKFKEAEANIENLHEYDEKAFSEFLDLPISVLDKYAPHENEIKSCILYAQMIGKYSVANFLITDVYNIKMPHMEFERVKKYLMSMKKYLSLKEMGRSLPSGYIYGYNVKSMKDERCCDFCKQMEGRFFEASEAILGVTYPPFDQCKQDICRCYASATMIKK